MLELRATAVTVYDSADRKACGLSFGEADCNEHLLVDPQLPCSGCAHSASGAPFPGHPSGERPCLFCARNPRRDPSMLSKDTEAFREGPLGKRFLAYGGRIGEDGVWYGGAPAFKTPMDCYIATDRLQQQRVFDGLDRSFS
jgi:hypothetical protein